MMSYLLSNTISKHGNVSRGKCQADPAGFLSGITELINIEKKDNNIVSTENNEAYEELDKSMVVSMNFWGFTPKCFEFGKELFNDFPKDHYQNVKSEFFISLILNEILSSGFASVKVLKSNAKWFGVTYKEDKHSAQVKLNKLISNGTYPQKLW